MLEGRHLLEAAVAAGLPVEELLWTPAFAASATAARLRPSLGITPAEVAPDLLASVTDADSPHDAVAVVRLPRTGVAALPVRPDGIYLFADGLQDPGNLGALARVAEAAGVVGLALGAGSVGPNHPRALRASAGSLLRLPVAREATLPELDDRLRAIAPRWLALVPRGGRDLYSRSAEGGIADEMIGGALCLAVGAEGPGLSTAAVARCDLRVTIALDPAVESLNAVVASALVLFEIRRRRALG